VQEKRLWQPRLRSSIANPLVVAATILLMALAAPLALAQDRAIDGTDLQAMRQAVKNDKRAYVESVMKLTDAEAKRFWPIYSAYQQTLDAGVVVSWRCKGSCFAMRP
jgi:hypothetical protein